MRTLIKEIIGREHRVISYSSPEDSLLRRVVINSIELSTGRVRIEEAYNKLEALKVNDATIWNHVFPLLEIELDFNKDQLKTLESKGPLLVIANHPYGVADGMALGYILSKLRENFLLVVNEVLCRERVLGKFFLPIDFRPTKEGMLTNLNTRKAALAHLEKGGAIGIFPSGGVATTPSLLSKKAVDLEWKNFVVKLARQTNASVLPVFFKGQNSAVFQIASHLHANIRLALLLNELGKKRKGRLEFIIGEIITHEEVAGIRREELLQFFKTKTFELELK